MNNFIVVIRSVGERTESLCKKLILDQGVEENNIEIIRESPFSSALRKSFKLGLESKKKWTFSVDADVLLREDSIKTMIEFAEKNRSNVCQVQGYILDKFFGGIRRGGVHLYRTELLPLAIQKIPDEGTNVRPESYLLRQMEKEGYPHQIEPYVVGTHDDQQYNFDIYRKAFVQAVKHTPRAELFIKLWRSKSENDSDFEVALRGFSDSLVCFDTVYIDKNLSLFRKKFDETGFKEKNEIDTSYYTPEDINNIIENWTYPDIYLKIFPDKDSYNSKEFLYEKKLSKSLKSHGLKKSFYLGLSKLFLNAGNSLKRKSKLV